MKHRYLLLIAALCFLGVGRVALAADGPGTQAVRKANDKIAQLLRKKVEPGSAAEKELAAQVTASVRDFLDVEALGRSALRDHWQSLPADRQQRFMTLLRQLIEKNYIKGLRANLDYEVVYTGETRKGQDIVVTTQVKTMRRGRPYTVSIDYVLRDDKGTLRAFDVITDRVGLVDNYRAQFNKIIAKDGIDGLLARMEKKSTAAD